MLAQAAANLGRTQDAEDYLRSSISSRQSHPLMQYEEQKCRLDLAKLLMQKGQYDESIAVLEVALCLERSSPPLTQWSDVRKQKSTYIIETGFLLPWDEDFRTVNLTLSILRELKVAYGKVHSAKFDQFEAEYDRRMMADSQTLPIKGISATPYSLPAASTHVDVAPDVDVVDR